MAVRSSAQRMPRPEWLKVRLGQGRRYGALRALLAEQGLHTVCRSARCPNIGECFGRGTATFLILGDRCTRNCRFCAVAPGTPSEPDPGEAARVAAAAAELGLRYVVVTSVTRDDLPDGGAAQFARTISALRARIPGCRVEVLVPDFRGDAEALETVLQAAPDVLAHNIETVRRLYPRVRPGADYERSLALLRRSSRRGVITKSGLMLGLGEEEDEVLAALHDLRGAGCSILALGQYLQPTREHLPVERFVPPAEFAAWSDRARALGFRHVAAGPLVRSSYLAEAWLTENRHPEDPGAAAPPVPEEEP